MALDPDLVLDHFGGVDTWDPMEGHIVGAREREKVLQDKIVFPFILLDWAADLQ